MAPQNQVMFLQRKLKSRKSDLKSNPISKILGTGIASMAVARPDLVMKAIIPGYLRNKGAYNLHHGLLDK